MGSISLMLKYISLKTKTVVTYHLKGTVLTRKLCFLTFFGEVTFVFVDQPEILNQEFLLSPLTQL